MVAICVLADLRMIFRLEYTYRYLWGMLIQFLSFLSLRTKLHAHSTHLTHPCSHLYFHILRMRKNCALFTCTWTVNGLPPPPTTHTHTHTCVCVCMYIYIYMCVCVCVHTYIHTFTYIFISWELEGITRYSLWLENSWECFGRLLLQIQGFRSVH
jgi:hypothetical protein